jgi:hypothetical protein
MASIFSMSRRRSDARPEFDEAPPAGLEPGFTPGPYVLANNGQMILADDDGTRRLLAIVVSGAADRVQLPFRETAHLLKAAPDLFAVAQAAAELPDPAAVSMADTHKLCEQIRSLKEMAKWASLRAVGALG